MSLISEIIFQTIYKLLNTKSAIFRGPKTLFFRPTTLEEVIAMKSAYPEAKIVVGNTEIGKFYLFGPFETSRS